jgi:hypothetical protein
MEKPRRGAHMKVLPIILVVITVFFLASCTSTDQNNLDTAPFIGGSEGLAMDFVGGAPPDEVYDSGQMPFGIQVMIENVGETKVDQDDALVRLIGIDPAHFKSSDTGIEASHLETTLRGAAKLVDGTQVPGDLTTVVFPTDGDAFYYVPNLVGTDEILIRAELCYKYQTKSTTQICIKDQTLRNINNDKICAVNEEKIPQNSGSPLHITALREVPQGQHDVQVTFKIEHVGQGLFFAPGAPRNGYSKCDDSLQNPDQNRVKVHVFFQNIGTTPKISCPGFTSSNNDGAWGDVTLFQGQPREVSCTIKGNAAGNRIYQALLYIELDYNYLSYVEKPIIIRDVSTEEDVQN